MLLQPQKSNDPIAKAERMALNLRASKKAELLRSKRNRGDSVNSSSSNIGGNLPLNSALISSEVPEKSSDANNTALILDNS